MIVEKDEETEYLAINIGRPDIHDNGDMERWTNFQRFIHETDMPIVVNNAFNYIDGLIEANQFYDGGGFAYTFWLENETDMRTFIEQCEKVFHDVNPYAQKDLKTLNPQLDLLELWKMSRDFKC
jgi:hypothetical protein